MAPSHCWIYMSCFLLKSCYSPYSAAKCLWWDEFSRHDFTLEQQLVLNFWHALREEEESPLQSCCTACPCHCFSSCATVGSLSPGVVVWIWVELSICVTHWQLGDLPQQTNRCPPPAASDPHQRGAARPRRRLSPSTRLSAFLYFIWPPNFLQSSFLCIFISIYMYKWCTRHRKTPRSPRSLWEVFLITRQTQASGSISRCLGTSRRLLSSRIGRRGNPEVMDL